MEQVRVFKEMRYECIRQLRMRGADINVRSIRPRFFVWENVPGAFSSNKGEDFRVVLEEVCRIADKDATIPRPEKGKWSTSGCIMGDGYSVAWRVHDAQFWGVPQRRKRIALVADFGGSTAPEILFERKSVSVDTEASGKEGEGASYTAESGVGETGKSIVYGISAYDSNAMKSSNPYSGIYEAETARTLDLNGGSPACNQGGMAVVSLLSKQQSMETSTKTSGTLGANDYKEPQVVCIEGNGSRPSHQGDGYKESETMYTLNSTEHHAVCVENYPADSRVKVSEDGIVQTLSSRMGTGGGNVPMVLDGFNLAESEKSPTLMCQRVDTKNIPMVMESINGEVADTLDASYYKGCGERQGVEREVVYMEPVCVGNGQLAQARISDKVGTLNCMHDQQAVITYGLDRASFNQGENAKFNFSIEEEKIGAQVAKGPGAVCQSVVRRLTPLESTRLQGFPDGWVDIGDWIDSKGKVHKDADSPKYKALGNSIALPFWEWMAKKMVRYIDHKPTMASLFDGIGGFPLVFSRCGCEPVWASEIEEFPIAVTKIRFKEGGE